MHVPAEDLDGFEFTCPGSSLRQRIPISESSKKDAFSCGFTFGLREFKSVLQFCESPGVEIEDMTLFFNEPGTPFLFTSDFTSSDKYQSSGDDESLLHPHSYVIELVMATLPPRIPQNSPPPIKSSTTTIIQPDPRVQSPEISSRSQKIVPESTQNIGNKSKKRFRRIFDDDYDNENSEWFKINLVKLLEKK